MTKKFTTILADPPWNIQQKGALAAPSSTTTS